MEEVSGALDGFVVYKGDPSLKIVEPIPIKAMGPFLRIKKKIDPLMNLGETKQTTLRSPSPQEEDSPNQCQGEGVKTPNPTAILPQNLKRREKSILPYKTIEVPLPEAAIKKRRLDL